MEHNVEDFSDEDQIFCVSHAERYCVQFPVILFGNVDAFEGMAILALLHERHHNLGQFSHKELAHYAGMSISSLKRTLNSLKEKKLIKWETINKNKVNVYELTLDHLAHRELAHTELGQAELAHTELPLAHTELATPGVLGSGDTSHLYTLDSSKEESNIDNIDKNNIYNIEQKDKENSKATTPSKSAKIPERFKPVSKLLIEWWKNHKAGMKSETAWSLLIGELDKILKDESVNGDIESISQLLYNGITSSEKGKPWQSIRYVNWVAYNKKQWIAFKESQLTVEKSSQRSSIIIPDYHKNV